MLSISSNLYGGAPPVSPQASSSSSSRNPEATSPQWPASAETADVPSASHAVHRRDFDQMLGQCANPLQVLVDALASHWKQDVWLRRFQDLPPCVSNRKPVRKGPVLLRLLLTPQGKKQPSQTCLEIVTLAKTGRRPCSALLALDDRGEPGDPAARAPVCPSLLRAFALADRFIRLAEESCDFSTAVPELKHVLAPLVAVAMRDAVLRGATLPVSEPPAQLLRFRQTISIVKQSVASGSLAAAKALGQTLEGATLQKKQSDFSAGIFGMKEWKIDESALAYFRRLHIAMTQSCLALSHEREIRHRRSLADSLTVQGLLTDAGWITVKGAVRKLLPSPAALDLWVAQADVMQRYQGLPGFLKTVKTLEEFGGVGKFCVISLADCQRVDGVLIAGYLNVLAGRTALLKDAVEKISPVIEQVLKSQTDLSASLPPLLPVARSARRASSKPAVSSAEAQFREATVIKAQKLLAEVGNAVRRVRQLFDAAEDVAAYDPAVSPASLEEPDELAAPNAAQEPQYGAVAEDVLSAVTLASGLAGGVDGGEVSRSGNLDLSRQERASTPASGLPEWSAITGLDAIFGIEHHVDTHSLVDDTAFQAGSPSSAWAQCQPSMPHSESRVWREDSAGLQAFGAPWGDPNDLGWMHQDLPDKDLADLWPEFDAPAAKRARTEL